MKVVLIGGSSPSTPALIEYLAGIKGLPPIEIVLLGSSHTRLALVNRACRALIGDGPITVTSIPLAAGHWPETLVGADVIALQARVGGYEARAWDETFPLRYGICGDQELGPGGLANAWRSWEHVKHFFQEAAARAPGALFIVLSSPVGLLVRLGLLAAPQLRIAGICELPLTTLLEVTSVAGALHDGLSFGYIGVNHLGWFYQLKSGVRDLISEYESCTWELPGFPSVQLVHEYSAIPTKYARLHFERNKVLAEQIRTPGLRSSYLAAYRDRVLSVFERGILDEIKAVLRERPTPWYCHAVGPLIAALAGSNVSQPLFLSRSISSIEEFTRNEVLELAYYVREREIHPMSLPRPIPDVVLGCLGQFTDAERSASDAIWRRDPEALRQTLAAHPWTRSLDDGQRCSICEQITRCVEANIDPQAQ